MGTLIGTTTLLKTQDTVSLQLQNLFVKLTSSAPFKDVTQMISDVSCGTTPLHHNLTRGSFFFLALAKPNDIGDREVTNLANTLINYFKVNEVVSGTYALTLLGELKFLLSAQHRHLQLELEWYASKELQLDETIASFRDPFLTQRTRLAELLLAVVSKGGTMERLTKLHLLLNEEFKTNGCCQKVMKKVFL